MFIQIGVRRINLSLVKEYRAGEKTIPSNLPDYFIQFIYPDNSKEEIHFFKDKDDRDKILKRIDENFVINLS
jgi:hypothetical protein